MSYEELNVDNAIKTETSYDVVIKNDYSPATKAFKNYDQKQIELMKQVFANRKCLDDSDSSSSSFGECSQN